MASNEKNSGVRRLRKKGFLNFDRNWKNFLIYGFVFLFLAFLFMGFTQQPSKQASVPLSQVISEVKQGKVSDIEVQDTKLVVKRTSGETIETFKEPGSNVY